MDESQLQKLIRDRLGLRIEPEMARYAARQLEKYSAAFAIIGGDARSGMPRRQMIEPQLLRAGMKTLQNSAPDA